MRQLQLRFLGGMSIGQGEELLSDQVAAKALALLCYLAVTAGQHTRGALAGLLWSDFPEQRARSNLRDTLHTLRRTELAPYIRASRRHMAFSVELPHRLDTADFSAGVHQSLASEPVAVARLQAAVDLYRGEFLAGFYVPRAALFEEWVLAQRQQFTLLAIEARQQLANYHLSVSAYEAGIPLARELVALDTWREESHRTLMLLLLMNGQLNAAVQQYQTCRTILADELGVPPAEETQVLYENILKQLDGAHPEGNVPGASLKLRRPDHNLPVQTTPFIGREDERQAIDNLLGDPANRLITILGVGGIGKTRLALAVGERQGVAIRRDGAYRFPDGVFFVPMQALESPGEIVPAICHALGFQPLDEGREGRPIDRQLCDFLRHKRLLLILDNFEQLLDGAPILADIHRSAPNVHLLVTSRQRLSMRGERLYPLKGLTYPNLSNQAIDSGQLEAGYAAAGLFMSTARRVKPDFQLSEDEVKALVQICHLVDGLPLAVELAAGWANLLSLTDISAEIEHSLSFLESDLRDWPDRHRSMEAVFNVSWRRLSSAEQTLFSQLCVFRGGFTRVSAQRVTGASLRQLATLVSRTLIQYEKRSDRYQIHRLLRQYGAAKLACQPAVERTVKERHCSFFSASVQEWRDLLKGAGQLRALACLTVESVNVRAAWRFALEARQFENLDRMVEGLCLFYLWRRWFHEGESACKLAEERLAQRLSASKTEQELAEQERLLAKVMTWHSVFCVRTEGRDLVNGALDLLEYAERAGVDVRREKAFAWRRAGDLVSDDDQQQKRSYYQHSLDLYQDLEDAWGLASVLTNLGWVAAHCGDADKARHVGEEALRLRKSVGDFKGTADTLWLLGTLAIGEGYIERATRLLGESLDLRKRVGDRVIDIAAGPIDLGMTLTWIGRMDLADEVRVEALALYEALGLPERIAEAHVRLATSKLHVGQLEALRRHATIGIELCGEFGNRRLVGVATWLLALDAFLTGELQRADKLFRESAMILRAIEGASELGWVFGLWAVLAHRLGQPERARHYCYEALRAPSGPLSLITYQAAVSFYRNLLLDLDQEARALEFNALLYKFPLITKSYFAQSLEPRRVATLAASLPPEVASAAVARGRARDLRETAGEILAELKLGLEG